MKKIIEKTGLVLLLLLLVHIASARKITLTKSQVPNTPNIQSMKIGNISSAILNNTIIFSNGIPANGSVTNIGTQFMSITYEEGPNGIPPNVSYNWSEVLRLYSEIINFDPDCKTGNASYTITFGDNNSAQPYIIGKQRIVPNPGTAEAFAYGYNVLFFYGPRTGPGKIQNVTITTDQGPANLEYEGGFYYGGWLNAGQSYSKTKLCNGQPCGTNTQASSPAIQKLSNIFLSSSPGGWQSNVQAHIGTFCHLQKCNNFLIENITVNGNISNQQVGGPATGSARIQQQHSGVVLWETTEMTMTNSAFNDFGLDGATIRTTSSGVDFTDCDFLRNGRQGLSWTGGDGITMTRCKFNETGKNSLGHFSPPTAGVDIEPSKHKNVQYSCKNGKFIDCHFVDNLSNCLLQDSGYPYAQTVDFIGCTFHNIETNRRAIWVEGRKFYFEDCDISGGFINGNKESNPAFKTIFKSCRFEDKALLMPGSTTTYYNTFGNKYLFNTDRCKHMLIDDCTFTVNTEDKALINVRSRGANPNEFIEIRNSHFIYTATPTNSGQISRFRGVVFDGKNSITNLSNKHIRFYSDDLVFQGNDDKCERNSFDITGLVQFKVENNGYSGQHYFDFGYNPNSSSLDRYFDLNINQDAFLFGHWGLNYNVGEKSSMNINSDAQLLSLGGNYNNDGKIFFGDGCFTKIRGAKNLSSADAEFYIHDNISATNPIWANSTTAFNGPTDWANMVLPVCSFKYDGGRTSLNAGNSTEEFEALDFTNGRVSMLTPAKLSNFALGDFSIEASFKANTNYAGWGTIFEKGTNTHLMIAGNGRVVLTIDNGPKNGRYDFFAGLKDGDCHKIVVVYNNTTEKVKLFVDGQFFAEQSRSYPFNPTTIYNHILIGSSRYAVAGNRANPLCYKFHGWIGEVRLWDKVLTEEDVCYNYKRKNPLNTNNLLADWTFRYDPTYSTSVSTLVDNVLPAANGNILGSTVPTWVSQTTLGSCFTQQNNSDVLGSFKNAPIADIETIAEVKESGISIYPNPVLSKLKIIGVEKGADYKVLDVTGKLIKSGKLNESMNIDVSGISNGIYLIGFGKSQKFEYIKFIKE